MATPRYDMLDRLEAYKTNNLGGLPTVKNGIDFMAFAKGAEAAKDLNWRDMMRAREEKRLVEQDVQNETNKIAQNYMSTFMHNLQVAAKAGVPTHVALAQFRDQILNDPYYQGMPDIAKQAVQTRLLQTVRLQADELVKQGRMPETMKLLESFGMTSPYNKVDIAAAHGNPQQFVDAYNAEYGGNVQLTPEGNIVAYPGATPIPAGLAMQSLARYKTAGSLYGPMYNYGIGEQGRTVQGLYQQLTQKYLENQLGLNDPASVDPNGWAFDDAFKEARRTAAQNPLWPLGVTVPPIQPTDPSVQPPVVAVPPLQPTAPSVQVPVAPAPAPASSSSVQPAPMQPVVPPPTAAAPMPAPAPKKDLPTLPWYFMGI